MKISSLIESKDRFDPLNIINYLHSINVSMDGGNCGTFALALAEIYGKSCHIGVITNVETEEELINDEPDVYHVVIIIGNVMYDTTGKTNAEALLNLAFDQYGNNEPHYFVFDYPQEKKNIEFIVRNNTNFSVNIDKYKRLIKQML